jgi:hypothetical protein
VTSKPAQPRAVTFGLRRAVATLALLSGLVALTSWGVAAWLVRDATVAQRILPDPNAALFGDGLGAPIGSPLEYAVSDPAAFLPGRGAAGERLLNEAYLREHGIYPLQVKTVWFVQRTVAVGAGVAALLLGVVWLRVRTIPGGSR